MRIDLNRLRPIQAALDAKILANHQVKSQDTRSKRILAFLVETGELANETRCFKYWSLKDASERSIILEEYVDGIHFIVSLANDLDMDLVYEVQTSQLSLTQQFLDVFDCANKLNNNFDKINMDLLAKRYLQVGLTLGFNYDDIINAYMEKNEKNHQRQEEGY